MLFFAAILACHSARQVTNSSLLEDRARRKFVIASNAPGFQRAGAPASNELVTLGTDALV